VTRPLTEVGFYGKLPCRGDFLQRRAPQSFVDVWDTWLQECLHASRERLQDTWLEIYLTAPVWRFVADSGVCGEGAYAGILVPSVDRVGRYFPLTVIAQLDAGDCPLAMACGNKDWFEAAESLVLEALDAPALDFDSFDERIALLRERLDVGSLDESSRLAGLLRDSEFPAVFARWQLPLVCADSLQSAMNAFAYREMSRVLAPLAFWWTEGSSVLAPTSLATRGLPQASSFVAMLTGHWASADWASVGAGEGY
jgi:type VI secretion system protein ImpM